MDDEAEKEEGLRRLLSEPPAIEPGRLRGLPGSTACAGPGGDVAGERYGGEAIVK